MYKQVIIVRGDLKMGIGKTIAQAVHAAVGSIETTDKKVIERWKREGCKKVVLKVDSLKELKEIYTRTKIQKLPCFLVKDAGLTQLRPGTITVLAIGPAKESDIDKITGKLRLL